MKSNRTLTEMGWRIAGGIMMAALAVVIAIFGIVCLRGLAYASPQIGHFVNKWSLQQSLAAVLISCAGVGFVVGLLIGHRYSDIIRKWFGISVIAALLPLFWVLLNQNTVAHVAVPRVFKVADCTNQDTMVQVQVPPGHDYNLALILPSSFATSITARIRIDEAGLFATNFQLISGPQGRPCGFLSTRTNVTVEIKLDQTPPPLTSLEIHFQQTFQQIAAEKAVPR